MMGAPAIEAAGATNQRSSGVGWAWSPEDVSAASEARASECLPTDSSAGRAAANTTALQNARTTDHRARERMRHIVYRAPYLRSGQGNGGP